jgi:hypothetical protein
MRVTLLRPTTSVSRLACDTDTDVVPGGHCGRPHRAIAPRVVCARRLGKGARAARFVRARSHPTSYAVVLVAAWRNEKPVGILSGKGSRWMFLT